MLNRVRVKPQHSLQWGLHRSQWCGAQREWKHWWKEADAADAGAKLGEQSNALRLQSATEDDLLWLLGHLHCPCHGQRPESRAGHQPGIKAGEEGEGRGRQETLGDDCTCPLCRQFGLRNQASVTGKM